MRYKEALNIGSVCEGTIQCTYATIYDASGKGLFSLQRKQATRFYNYTSGGDVFITDTGKGVDFGMNDGSPFSGTDIDGRITIEMPLVYVTEHSDATLVPAHLTDEAIEIITRALEKIKTTRYTVYLVCDYTTSKMAKGEKKVVAVQYYRPDIDAYNLYNSDHRYHYELETEQNIISPKYRQLIDIIQTGDIVYIKPAAFKWAPIDGFNATITDADGKVIKLSDALAAAKQKVEQAKAILAAAGVAAFI